MTEFAPIAPSTSPQRENLLTKPSKYNHRARLLVYARFCEPLKQPQCCTGQLEQLRKLSTLKRIEVVKRTGICTDVFRTNRDLVFWSVVDGQWLTDGQRYDFLVSVEGTRLVVQHAVSVLPRKCISFYIENSKRSEAKLLAWCGMGRRSGSEGEMGFTMPVARTAVRGLAFYLAVYAILVGLPGASGYRQDGCFKRCSPFHRDFLVSPCNRPKDPPFSRLSSLKNAHASSFSRINCHVVCENLMLISTCQEGSSGEIGWTFVD
eukprot:1195781-Prorocentrum_minimum.AAC.3